MHITLMALAFLAGQQNENADSYCVDYGQSVPDEAVFIVDDSIDDLWESVTGANAVGRDLNDTDILAAVDRAMQDIGRRSRGRIRLRASPGNCAAGAARCIAGDSGGECEDAAGTTAYGSGSIRICFQNLGAWDSGIFEDVVEHELGHAVGLDHTDTRVLEPCFNNAGCQGAESCVLFPGLPYGTCRLATGTLPCRFYDNAASSCTGSSDGCGGEMMCAIGGCGALSLSAGDAIGVRTVHSGTPTRSVYLGADTLPTAGTPAFATAGMVSFFAPRTDCAKATSGVSSQCGLVRTPSAQKIAIHRLNGYTSNANFSTQEFKYETTLPTGRHVVGSPDIALNATGSVAWVAWMDSNNGGELRVQRAVLQGTPALGTVVIDTYKFNDVVKDLQLVGAPRLAFNSDRPNCVQVLSLARRVSTVDPESFDGVAQRAYHEVCALTSTTFTVDAYDLDESVDSDMIGEYDWDCDSVTGADTCVVVGHRIVSDNASVAGDVEMPWSRRIQWTTVATTEPRFVSSWVKGTFFTNSILGVAAVNSSSLSPPQRLLVSGGRRVTSGTATSNTRLIERSQYALNSGALADAVNVSDAQSCLTHTDGTLTIPAMTAWGGYSWTYCASCGSSPGRMISTHFGAADGYCF